MKSLLPHLDLHFSDKLNFLLCSAFFSVPLSDIPPHEYQPHVLLRLHRPPRGRRAPHPPASAARPGRRRALVAAPGPLHGEPHRSRGDRLRRGAVRPRHARHRGRWQVGRQIQEGLE